MDKEELLQVANDVASKAAQNAEDQDMLFVIARIKANIFEVTNHSLSALCMADALSGHAMSHRITGQARIALAIAECAEIIMRREWIDKK